MSPGLKGQHQEGHLHRIVVRIQNKDSEYSAWHIISLQSVIIVEMVDKEEEGVDEEEGGWMRRRARIELQERTRGY